MFPSTLLPRIFSGTLHIRFLLAVFALAVVTFVHADIVGVALPVAFLTSSGAFFSPYVRGFRRRLRRLRAALPGSFFPLRHRLLLLPPRLDRRLRRFHPRPACSGRHDRCHRQI